MLHPHVIVFLNSIHELEHLFILFQFAAFLTAPFDVVKTHKQIEFGEKILYADKPVKSIPKVGTITILRQIFHQNGISGIFAGVTPRVVKVAPACAIMLTSFEYGKAHFFRQNLEAFFNQNESVSWCSSRINEWNLFNMALRKYGWINNYNVWNDWNGYDEKVQIKRIDFTLNIKIFIEFSYPRLLSTFHLNKFGIPFICSVHFKFQTKTIIVPIQQHHLLDSSKCGKHYSVLSKIFHLIYMIILVGFFFSMYACVCLVTSNLYFCVIRISEQYSVYERQQKNMNNKS